MTEDVDLLQRLLDIEWAMFDYVEWPQDGFERVGLDGYGHYLEEYVKEAGQWRIKKTHLARLRVDPLEMSRGNPYADTGDR